MQVNKIVVWIILIMGCGSCIEPFEPELRESQEVMVINGVITDQPGPHTVEISLSTSYRDPIYKPVPGCAVRVVDERGESQDYLEKEPGIYEAYLPASFLAVGKSYSIAVVAPDGNEYRSDFDTLLAFPPVDSVYFEVKSQETYDPGETLYGLQFYSDLETRSGSAANFRWALEETWEYDSPYTPTYIWFGGERPIDTIFEDTVTTCYMSVPVKSVFTATTHSLSGREIKRNPLNYVSNETPRLKIRYSLLVEQQSLTNDAFEYWDRLKSMTQGTGGLYETQPPSSAGNLYNTDDPSERVLGYFYATQPRYKRIFVDERFDFRTHGYTCEVDTFQSPEEAYDKYLSLPVYLISLSIEPVGPFPPFLSGYNACFDCKRWGGTNVKPEYWEQ